MKAIMLIAIFICAMQVTSSFALDAKSVKDGYSLHNKYCVSCHDSVANPERTGFTRDAWHLTLNLMHKHGLQKLSNEEKEALIDYLFTIRKGMEQEAG
ncbi:cytochrome c oxidase, cbb3-type, subunit III [Desulfuromonas soudanensis]|uniref:Cytochrome c oxidase, cbb3-type, subunit III n=1 Tax=Desulfuromonas soudanensis TaxID=1603606 RepID=A0A0M4DG13_9BACT|nr:cytochrome c [Desulfuromonas soudanensis]ALC15507.1 cytochrome c oxidase, cbb3-type, subunit III [Desulfuromonas soudanensis]